MPMPYSSSKSRNRNSLLIAPFLILTACQSSIAPEDSVAEIISTADRASSEELIIKQAINSPVLEIEQDDVIESFNDLWDRLRTKFQLAQHYQHPAVDKHLTAYANNQVYFDRISERAQPFLFWIVGEIERRELPMELALIPIVESTFNPNAYSPKHAVGLWQFIGPTAKSFGLQQDWWYDGRRDPRASTIAALNFLEEL